MDCLITQKLNKKPIFKKIEDFSSSHEMSIFCALIVILSHNLGLEFYAYGFIFLLGSFIFISNASLKGIIPPFLYMLYAVSTINYTQYENGDFAFTYFIENIIFYLALFSILSLSAVYGIWKRNLKLKITPSFVGVMAMGLALLLNGFLSADYSIYDFIVGIIFALDIVTFFLLFNFMRDELDFDHIAITVTISTIIIMVELLRLYQIEGLFSGTLEKSSLLLGWGISNSMSVMIAVGLPFSAYYMATKKYSITWFFIFCMQMLCIILTLSRGVLILAIPFGVGAAVYALFRSKGTARTKLFFCYSTVLIVTSYVVFNYWDWVADKINFYIETGLDDRGRFELYEMALEGFFGDPIFGTGVLSAVTETSLLKTMIHNTFLQFMYWSGIIGLIAITMHVAITAVVALKKPTEKKIFMIMGIGVIFAHSIIDIVWFMPFTQIFYMLMLNYAEKECAESGAFGDKKYKLLPSFLRKKQ